MWRIIHAALWLALVPFTAVAFPYGEDPDDPRVVAASQQAVNALGEGHGALSIIKSTPLELHGDRVGIIGLASRLQGEIAPLEQAIETLGAVVTDTLIEVALSSDVLFDFDSDALKPAAESSLLELKTLIENVEVLEVTIIGHTDTKGSDEYNLGLSARRAESVRAWLVSAGLDGGMFIVEGKGESDPVAPNTSIDGSDDPEGRALNRRVEIEIRTRQTGSDVPGS